MNHRAHFSLLACAALFPLTAACNPSDLSPIGSGSSSSTATGSCDSPGSGGTGGTESSGSPTSAGSGGLPDGPPCSPGCGNAGVCLGGECHALIQLDVTGAVNSGVCTIVADADSVYWKTAELRRVPRAGGAATVLDFSTSSPAGLVVDATYLFWTNLGVQRVEKNSPGIPGTSAGIFYADEGGSPTRMVGDGTKLYYLEGSSIYEAPQSGAPAPQAPPTVFSGTWSGVTGTPIAVDAQSLYLWTQAASLLTKIDKTTHQAVNIAAKGNTKIDDTCGIMSIGQGVYFSTAPTPGKGGTVARMNKLGMGFTVIVDDTNGANGVFTVDQSTLYFMTPTAVMRASSGGGPATLVSPFSVPSPFPTCMGIDDDYVYWVDGLKLMRLAKVGT